MSIYKGGYITIDCGGGDIATEEGVTIPGVFNAVKDTEGKLVILKNLLGGGEEPILYMVLPLAMAKEDEYEFISQGQMVIITNTDVIYAVSLE